MNNRLAASVLAGGGAAAMIAAILVSTPTSARPGSTLTAAHRLPALRYDRPAALPVQHNPFAPLVDATPRPNLALGARAPGAAHASGGTPYAAGGPASGTGPAGPSMVLCATWFDQAAFRVGSDAPEIAGVGDVVGGYRVAKIDSDGVDFASGERLDIQDCMGANDGAAAAEPGVVAAPASVPNAPAYVPDPSIITPPNETPNATLRAFTAPTPSASPAPDVAPPVEFGRVPRSGTYGATVYGQQPPTPKPNYIRRIP